MLLAFGRCFCVRCLVHMHTLSEWRGKYYRMYCPRKEPTMLSLLCFDACPGRALLPSLARHSQVLLMLIKSVLFGALCPVYPAFVLLMWLVGCWAFLCSFGQWLRNYPGDATTECSSGGKASGLVLWSTTKPNLNSVRLRNLHLRYRVHTSCSTAVHPPWSNLYVGDQSCSWSNPYRRVALSEANPRIAVLSPHSLWLARVVILPVATVMMMMMMMVMVMTMQAENEKKPEQGLREKSWRPHAYETCRQTSFG